ncbi:DALR anticodon-binding domain-containing protein [Streptomyces sp. TX20-6-3]|uniref:ArgS-related anticodon-binding protein NrtL n=1 Tax=Streptomyces sp. TX20-6-3 TaxID=3028705 RepID=UPI0029B9E002|nr:DALR anticodon-binding domain-containing protein [Streptomyces sp. TX20-6-3]MDX2559321.1 DALR anticodon-binding domain-containing protein [Streptomyces sp. TX20-6-3]
MTPADLSLTVLHAVRRAVDDGALRVDVPPTVKVERARPGGVGEYASNVALTLARSAGRTALDVAGILEKRLRDAPGLQAVDVTGPGFLNFTLRSDAGGELVRAVREAGDAYGSGTALAGLIVRFADLTESRALLVTETVVRLLRSQGADAGFRRDERTPEESVAPRSVAEPVDPTAGPSVASRSVAEPVDAGPPAAPPTPPRLGERIHVHPGDYDPDTLGVDAARWALLRAAPQDRPLDGPPLLVQHERNSLFRVRYAHSRVRRLLANAAQLGFEPAYETPVHAPELLGVLGDHPVALLTAARHRAPDRVARHLEATADALLAFQHTVLPLGDEKPSAAHRSRLALAEAAGTVLAGGLSVLGISAPERI